MKLILVGAIAAVTALVFAGTATARILEPSFVHKPVLMPRSGPALVGFIAIPTVTTQHVAVGYGDFPEVARSLQLERSSSHASATTANGGGFDWRDGGIGVGTAFGVAAIVALFLVGMRRHRATPLPA